MLYCLDMNLMLKNHKLLLLFLMIVYIFAMSLGVATMTMAKDGATSDCPFMGVDSICQMGTFEHIATFQNMFSSIYKNTFVMLLSLFLFATLLSIPVSKLQTVIQIRPSLFFKTNESGLFFNKFLLALSNGTLQPKLYA